MTKILIASILLAFSLNVTANGDFNADDELKELGIVGQDFKFIDLDRAIDFFNKAKEKASSSLTDKSNELIKITAASMTPHYSSVTLSPTLDLSEAEEKDLADFISTKEGFQVWCKELFNFKYMGVNDHKVEVLYKNKVGETLGNIILNNKNCR
ncbi:hypothetical protein NDN11_08515 [Acinetobacter sp. C26M]|uniref:hypothetical protein n=1 Tax=unclassified Acinetobacter TaxID=196816 RepID=UPI002036BDD3|nr:MULTISPECIES: hypothetical protein [unclassified Acinetobacter]USA48136.1 hypothetical protein NDN11_08515 [Acinetobacter sp. C26M]USA51616.1 hypothetical protein NDN12_08515 [Acinetobacter sp. C26G]